ncbi:MAG TPA: hypothetical protein VLD61_00170 [Methylomirabilota bacterium]|nr:hypothetical protein [Methylomirabilota bacterium]
MTASSPPPPELPEECAHPWLLVTCGACGAAVDELRPGEPGSPGRGSGSLTRAQTVTAEGGKKLFIVARGHPELVEQLKALLADSVSVQVIEDRRRIDRNPPGAEAQGASAVRSEFRRRIRESGAADDV